MTSEKTWRELLAETIAKARKIDTSNIAGGLLKAAEFLRIKKLYGDHQKAPKKHYVPMGHVLHFAGNVKDKPTFKQVPVYYEVDAVKRKLWPKDRKENAPVQEISNMVQAENERRSKICRRSHGDFK